MTMPEQDRLLLQKVEAITQRRISVAALDELLVEPRVWFDEMMDDMVVQLKTYVYATPKERIVVNRKWPADWWQAFKERWFPRCLLRRWPVRWERLEIDEPTFGPTCPHLGDLSRSRHFNFLAQGDTPELQRTPE